MNIDTKFTVGEKVYTIVQKDVYEECTKCRGAGYIKTKALWEDGTDDIVTFKCDECQGEGRHFTGGRKWFVDPMEYQVSKIKISVYNKSHTETYKIVCGMKSYNRASENVFMTINEAQKACDFKNAVKVTMNINDIKISDTFKDSIPSEDKIAKRIESYRNGYGFGNHQIIVNQENFLTDGYTQYLVCKMFGIENVSVVIQ